MARKSFRSLAAGRSGLIADLGALLNDLARGLLHPYRPELHYMRGPGPKWQAKHGKAQAEFNAAPALARIRVKR